MGEDGGKLASLRGGVSEASSLTPYPQAIAMESNQGRWWQRGASECCLAGSPLPPSSLIKCLISSNMALQ